MVRRSCFALLACALVACASPTEAPPGGRRPGTSNGPGVDLGGFIKADPDDLATKAPADLSVSPADMAMPPPAADMTMPPAADMAMPPTSGCGSITWAGTCTGNTLRYCDTNQLQTIDCTTGGRQCTTVSGDSDCRFVAGAACGPVTTGGLCDGDTVVYCDGSGHIVLQNCAAVGSTCQKSFGYADCL